MTCHCFQIKYHFSNHPNCLGKFSFTLEDLRILLELPCFGKYNIYSLYLYQEENQIQDFISGLFKREHERSEVVW